MHWHQKLLSPTLQEILPISVKVVNFRGRALNHHVFKKLCQEMGPQHEVLLYHTEVRWLAFERSSFEAFDGTEKGSFIFLREEQNPLSVQFDCKEFLYGLAYLADIFSHLNEVNLSIQGPDLTIIDVAERLQAFQAKLPLWKRRLETETTLLTSQCWRN